MIRFAAIVFAALILPSIAHAQDATVRRGKVIVERNCARCHAVGRQGTSPLAKAPPFRELSRRYPVDFLAESLAEGITTGHKEMPAFQFKPNEIEQILAYLRSLSPR